MIVKAMAKTLYIISELLMKRSKQEKMMHHHLKLCRAYPSAIPTR